MEENKCHNTQRKRPEDRLSNIKIANSAIPNPTRHETNSWKEQGKGEEKQNKQRREEEKHCGKTHNRTKR
jgi:FMN-dependent NADH-azoreductase